MADTVFTASQRWRSLIAVIASMGVTATIYGMTMPLLALSLDSQGIDSTLIGMSAATQSLAVFLIAPATPWLIGRYGTAGLMIRGIVISLAAFLLLPVFPDVYAWFPLRFALGAAGSAMWIAGEAWVNQMAEDYRRGRIVALYTAALSGGFAVGPFILAQTGTTGSLPYLIVAAIIAISAIPVLFATGVAPRFEGRPSVRLPAFLLLAPVAMLLNLVFAASDGALLTFVSIYGQNLGLGEAGSLYLITVLGVGGMIFQIPMGWLMDRMDRVLLLVLCVLFMIACFVAMPFVIALETWNLVFFFVFGGVFAALYGLGVVLLGERFRGADLTSASAVFTLMWGVGSVIGPPVGGVGMDLSPSHGMPLSIALIFLCFLPFPIMAWIRRRRSTAKP